MVAWCEEQGTDFRAVTADVLSDFHPALEADLLDQLNPRFAAERRTSLGGTSGSEIDKQVAALRSWLG